MKENQAAAIAHVLDVEGGFSNHSEDAGGPTKYGVTLPALSRHIERPATIEELREMKASVAEAIYATQYWRPARCDELPAGVDLMHFDAAVHAGQGQATKWLQRAINLGGYGALGKRLLEDGALGSKTLKGANEVHEPALIRRMAFYRIIEAFDDPEDVHFARGWVDRVLKAVLRAAALIKRPLNEEEKQA